MPRGDLGPPPPQGASELADLGRTAGIAHVGRELIYPGERQLRVTVGIQLTDGLLFACQAVVTSPFGSPALSSPVSLSCEVSSSRSLAMTSSLRVPEQRIVLVAPVAEQLLVDPAAHLVEPCRPSPDWQRYVVTPSLTESPPPSVTQRGAQQHPVVLVSCRFSSLRAADRIVAVEGGRIIEEGDHETLLARGGRYAELFRLQTEGYRGAHA